MTTGGFHHRDPVAYESCKLTAVEQAYPAHVLELQVLAVVHAFRGFRHYLLGSQLPPPPSGRPVGLHLTD